MKKSDSRVTEVLIPEERMNKIVYRFLYALLYGGTMTWL